MNKNVEIPIALYQRLGSHVQGFENPASVIERILDFYEEKQGTKKTESVGTVLSLPSSLSITYYPSDEESFKKLLLQKKVAYLLLHKIDGTKDLKEWNAINFTDQSSVNGNLRSGYLRDWQKKGIIKAEISTDRADFS